ncbi:MAG: MBL fold metallo-hydrolase [Gemmatales bacterium]|nr:MBL fold metallo-hydrolase [Gemmatales bacterium]MDW7995097.1 MBL fold metallo-hydrolase [Gemmatales bacterium]
MSAIGALEKTQLTAAQLKELLDRGEKIVLLDVRNEEEYRRWPIESRHPVRMLNIPYYQFVETPDSAVAQVPRDAPVVAVCAKGGSSAWVVEEILLPRGYRAANLEGGMQAWGRFYQPRLVPEAEPVFRIWQLERPARGCLHYLVAYGPQHREAIVIDPPRHLEAILQLVDAHQLKITHILDTHAHADHISGGVALAQKTGAPYYLHPYDGIHPIDVLPATIPYEMTKDGQTFILGQARLQVLHIPGHTLGNTALYLEGNGKRFLFSGDSIFIYSIARPDLGGRGEAWSPLHYRSLFERLLRLPDDTIVLPGHFSQPGEARSDGLFAATLAELKQRNPDLQPRSQSEFVQYMLSSLPEFPKQYIEIKRVNIGLLQPSEDYADELEFGKNVCALADAYRA